MLEEDAGGGEQPDDDGVLVLGAESEELVGDGPEDRDEDDPLGEPRPEPRPGHDGEQEDADDDDYEDEGGPAAPVEPGVVARACFLIQCRS